MDETILCTHPQHTAEDRGVVFFAPCFQCKGTRKIHIKETTDVQADQVLEEKSAVSDGVQVRADYRSDSTLER